jgi:hypothetical protein
VLGKVRSWPAPAALALVCVEGLLALVGVHSTALSAVALAGVPALALVPLLPVELGSLERWLVAPIMGLAAASLLVVSASAVGVPLTGLSVRLLLAAVALAGAFAASRVDTPALAAGLREQLPTALALAAILCLAVALQGRIIAGSPVPGTDWGHYLLYPDEIAHQHSLHIDNPFWMGGGQPFHDDPGVGALYGSFLILSHADAAVLSHGIWVFALLAIVSVFVFVSSLWGRGAGLAAAALYATIPMNDTLLGWHGLANLYGLCLLPLTALAVAWALRARTDWRWSLFLALALVALAAAHRLTFLVACIAMGLAAVAGIALAADRRRLGAFALRTAAFAAPLAAGVVVDLVRRSEGAGGVQSYKVYLVTKLDLSLAISDLTAPVAVAGAVALVALATRARADPALLAICGLAGGALVLSYGWIVHLPTVYYRAAYFYPLVLAAAIGVGATRLRGVLLPIALSAVVALAGSAALVARDRSDGVRAFYEWASPASLAGLGEVTRRTRPGEPVVADRCWAFLSEWLLRRPVLAGIDPADILPAWEAGPAAQARTILYGSPRSARRMAERRGVRFLLVNPGCKSDETGALRLPTIGVPIYESTRLVVLDLKQSGRSLRLSGRSGVPLARNPGAAGGD